ncbi:MAG: potassium transporter TrkG [Candidatus Methanomethylophilaceae archaeon]
MRKGYLLKRFVRWESRSIYTLGIVILSMSLLMIPCLILAVLNKENIYPFLWPILFGFAMSGFFILFFKIPSHLRPVDELLMMLVLWFTIILFGIVPYIVSGMGVVDAIFESTSGFTTTGASIMSDIESWPTSILLWRSLTHWIGGIMIVIMFMFVMSTVVPGSRSILKNETSGSGNSNLFIRLKKAGKQFIITYVVLTGIFVITFLILGVNLIDSLSISFGTISTGGFMNKNDSLAGFSWTVKLAAIVFMILSATNFYVHFKAIYQKKPSTYLHNQEFKVMIFWFLLVSTIISFAIFVNDELWASKLEVLEDIVFTIVSFGTTTGFSTVDYSLLWPSVTVFILAIMMFIGGSAGSTSGGTKISRMIIIVHAIKNNLRELLHPNAIFDVKYDKESVGYDAVYAATVVTLLFVITIVIGTLVFAFSGIDVSGSFFTTVALVTGTGPSINEFGPFGSYCGMSDFDKLFSCFIMWVGRMEITTALVILTPEFWREVFSYKKQ